MDFHKSNNTIGLFTVAILRVAGSGGCRCGYGLAFQTFTKPDPWHGLTGLSRVCDPSTMYIIYLLIFI